MRRPEYNEQWSDGGLVCWIDPPGRFSRARYITIDWPQIRAIRRHIEKGGTVDNCPIYLDRWAFSKIMVDMIGDGTE